MNLIISLGDIVENKSGCFLIETQCILTASVDLQFAEICILRDGKLHDDVSVSWQARVTALVDCIDTGVGGNTGV